MLPRKLAKNELPAPLELKPALLVDNADLPATACKLRDVLATSANLFARGVPVKLSPTPTGLPTVTELTRYRVVIEAHQACRPVMLDAKGIVQPVTLPYSVADMYLSMRDELGLRPLAGISLSPILEPDGSVRFCEGYDVEHALWCANTPTLFLKERPNASDAQAALRDLRHAFRTFPFADAVRTLDGFLAVDVVDLNEPPAADESALLTALLTAACRSSLDFAPGLLLQAPSLSGAGTGKGLLVRSISAIAFGSSPKAFSAGLNCSELDKRIAAALVTAEPMLFLDNLNGRLLRSDLLAQVLTEHSVMSRRLGATLMMPLSSKALVCVTGNGASISEDLARRFVVCELNAHCENPEQRDMPQGFLNDVLRRRSELLAAAFTILRWGRQNAAQLMRGRPLGSFEQWAAWCRDPLLTLGTRDTVERINAIKARDPERQAIAELFDVWHAHHGDAPVAASELAESVRKLIDPQGRGRQFIAARLTTLLDTRIGGFVLSQQKPSGRWGRATYVVCRVG